MPYQSTFHNFERNQKKPESSDPDEVIAIDCVRFYRKYFNNSLTTPQVLNILSTSSKKVTARMVICDICNRDVTQCECSKQAKKLKEEMKLAKKALAAISSKNQQMESASLNPDKEVASSKNTDAEKKIETSKNPSAMILSPHGIGQVSGLEGILSGVDPKKVMEALSINPLEVKECKDSSCRDREKKVKLIDSKDAAVSTDVIVTHDNQVVMDNQSVKVRTPIKFQSNLDPRMTLISNKPKYSSAAPSSRAPSVEPALPKQDISHMGSKKSTPFDAALIEAQKMIAEQQHEYGSDESEEEDNSRYDSNDYLLKNPLPEVYIPDISDSSDHLPEKAKVSFNLGQINEENDSSSSDESITSTPGSKNWGKDKQSTSKNHPEALLKGTKDYYNILKDMNWDSYDDIPIKDNANLNWVSAQNIWFFQRIMARIETLEQKNCELNDTINNLGGVLGVINDSFENYKSRMGSFDKTLSASVNKISELHAQMVSLTQVLADNAEDNKKEKEKYHGDSFPQNPTPHVLFREDSEFDSIEKDEIIEFYKNLPVGLRDNLSYDDILSYAKKLKRTPDEFLEWIGSFVTGSDKLASHISYMRKNLNHKAMANTHKSILHAYVKQRKYLDSKLEEDKRQDLKKTSGRARIGKEQGSTSSTARVSNVSDVLKRLQGTQSSVTGKSDTSSSVPSGDDSEVNKIDYADFFK